MFYLQNPGNIKNDMDAKAIYGYLDAYEESDFVYGPIKLAIEEDWEIQ